jgi:hypothetical protein
VILGSTLTLHGHLCEITQDAHELFQLISDLLGQELASYEHPPQIHSLLDALTQVNVNDQMIHAYQLRRHPTTATTTTTHVDVAVKSSDNKPSKPMFGRVNPFCGLLSSQVRCVDCGQTVSRILYI